MRQNESTPEERLEAARTAGVLMAQLLHWDGFAVVVDGERIEIVCEMLRSGDKLPVPDVTCGLCRGSGCIKLKEEVR